MCLFQVMQSPQGLQKVLRSHKCLVWLNSIKCVTYSSGKCPHISPICITPPGHDSDEDDSINAKMVGSRKQKIPPGWIRVIKIKLDPSLIYSDSGLQPVLGQ